MPSRCKPNASTAIWYACGAGLNCLTPSVLSLRSDRRRCEARYIQIVAFARHCSVRRLHPEKVPPPVWTQDADQKWEKRRKRPRARRPWRRPRIRAWVLRVCRLRLQPLAPENADGSCVLERLSRACVQRSEWDLSPSSQEQCCPRVLVQALLDVPEHRQK
jgi:hypothetical protein